MTRQDFALFGPLEGQGQYCALRARGADTIGFLQPGQGVVTLHAPRGLDQPGLLVGAIEHTMGDRSMWAPDDHAVQVLSVDDGVVTLVGPTGAALLDPARFPGQDGFSRAIEAPEARALAAQLRAGELTWEGFGSGYAAMRAADRADGVFVATPDLAGTPGMSRMLGPLASGLNVRQRNGLPLGQRRFVAPQPGTPEYEEMLALRTSSGPVPSAAEDPTPRTPVEHQRWLRNRRALRAGQQGAPPNGGGVRH